MGYNGTPPEVASLVSYIVSKEAHFITGRYYSISYPVTYILTNLTSLLSVIQANLYVSISLYAVL